MRAADLPALLSLQERGSVAALAHVFPQDVYPFPGDAVRERWIAELADPDIAAYVATAGSANGGLVAYAASSGDELLHFGTAFETWGSGLAVWVHDQFVATFPREPAPAGGGRLPGEFPVGAGDERSGPPLLREARLDPDRIQIHVRLPSLPGAARVRTRGRCSTPRRRPGSPGLTAPRPRTVGHAGRHGHPDRW